MNHFDQLRELMALTFGVSAEAIMRKTQQDQTPEWDSIGHLNLMLAIEDAFGLSLGIDDMTRLTSVEAILGHLNGACRTS